ncbi:MAG: UDP-N-acetylmuramoyl-L-alanyl-D-glutamate--2,6-diaminopimelate ligase [Ectothiorhodospiraceae bacterium]|nr:UDP-N-acetylmuramoyl-L-alanyl-D-glutamate--2,6-diaminopimelate ligase [Ectothiorhodospiraceae bacterium]
MLSEVVQQAVAADVPVTGLSADSRELRQGWVFAACAGERQHGLRFLDQALSAQPSAVLWEPSGDADAGLVIERCGQAGLPAVAVPRLGAHLGPLAARAFQNPSADLRVIGVTGTDGKTSVSQFLAQALQQAEPCGVIGTLGHGRPGELQSLANTTPDAARVQGLLADFRGQGLSCVSMEVSSHGLDQGRVDGVRFHTAVLTNLGRDHLDYHGSLEAYADAKRRLFAMPGLQAAVLNMDDGLGRSIHRQLPQGVRCIGYSMQSDDDAEVVCTSLSLHEEGMRVEVITPVGLVEADLPLLGRFNVENVLAVIGVLCGLGWKTGAIARGVARIRPVPGRMERFPADGHPLVVVDYAHTAGALSASLAALREHVNGRVWCVFGCGGERDRGKRPLMAAAAEAGSDAVIVTDDNPRCEDPDAIVQDILNGFIRDRALVIRDRKQAIAHAVAQASPGDVVLVAGKGHEDYQETSSGRTHYSDRETVAALMARGTS